MKRLLIVTAIILSLLAAVFLFFTTAPEPPKVKLKPNYNDSCYTPDYTAFVVPLSIALKDIQDLANLELKPLLLDDTIPVRNGKDFLYLKLKKRSDLLMRFSNNKLQAEIPIEAEIRYKWKNSKKIFFNDTPFTVQLNVLIETPVLFNETYGFDPKTNIRSVSWVKKPVLDIGILKIAVDKYIEDRIYKQETRITKTLDAVIEKKISLRKTVARLWGKIQRPVLLSKKTGLDYYLREEPSSLAVWTEPYSGDSLNLILQLTGLMHIVHSKDTVLFARTPLPEKITILKTEPENDTSYFNVHFMIPLNSIESISNKGLKGKGLSYQDYKVEIGAVLVRNGADNILFDISYTGDIAGNMLLKGKPVLDIEKQCFMVSGLEYENRPDDAIVDAADNVFHDMILDRIKQSAVIDLKEIIDTIPDVIQKGIRKSKLATQTNISLGDFELIKATHYLTVNHVQFIVKGRTKVDIQVKREAILKRAKAKKGKA